MTGAGGGHSSSTTTTKQSDERIAASDNAIVLQLDSGASLQVTDPAAWDALGVVVGSYENILQSAVDFASAESNKATGLVAKALDQNKPQDTQNYSSLLKWGTVIALAVAASGAIKKG